LERRHLLYLIGIGLLGNTAYQLFFVFAIAITTAENSARILATVPVWVALIGTIFGVERVEVREVDWITKTFEKRTVPIDPGLKPVLEGYQDTRTENVYGLYFLSKTGVQVSDHIGRAMTKLTGKDDVSVHTFPHTHISHALDRWGRSLPAVQKWVGRKKLETTQLCAHTSLDDLHREALKTG
jgi:site-specific recombinase XerC